MTTRERALFAPSVLRAPSRSKIGDVLDAVCAARHWSGVRFADEISYDHSYLSKIRSGSREPSREWVAAVVERAALSERETVALYVACGYIPPGFSLVRDELGAPME